MQNVTLFVDGDVLKKHIIASGQAQTSQLVVQYLSHMVQAIRKEMPDSFTTIQYYGARLTDSISLPISGNNYTEPDLKKSLNHHSVPGAFLDNTWGRVSYVYEQPWILKPESYDKTKLTDSDFVLNERPKGVLAQLVCKMMENAVCSPNTPMYVFGDSDDMAYALHSSRWLGVKVRLLELDGKKMPFVSEVPMTKEPHFCDKNKIQKVGEFLRTRADKASGMRGLRAKCPEGDQRSVLMLDMGVIRKYLEKNRCRMNVENVQKVLDQIETLLPEKPTKRVLYCTFSNATKLISPFPGETHALWDASADKQLLSIPNVEVSAGKTMQDKWHPYYLKKEKWHVPADKRGYKDVEYDFRQYDVDDRIACDIALYAMDPTVAQVYLLATDGDFAYPVERAAQMGLPVTLIYFDTGAQDLSLRLQKRADKTIRIQAKDQGFVSRATEAKKRIAERKENRKNKQKAFRRWLRGMPDEDRPEEGTKEERWEGTLDAHRRVCQEHRRRR